MGKKDREAREHLDHGLSKDVNERFALKPGRGEPSRYDANDAATKFLELIEVSASTDSSCDCNSSRNAMQDP